MWDLPGPGLEPVSPALAGGFLTTVPPGKSQSRLLKILFIYLFIVAAPGLSCGTWALSCGTRALSCGTRALSCGTRALSCAMHVGSSSSNQGSIPGPLHWEHRVLPTGSPGKSPVNPDFKIPNQIWGRTPWWRETAGAWQARDIHSGTQGLGRTREGSQARLTRVVLFL